MIKNRETRKSSNSTCDMICLTILLVCILFMAGFFLYTNPELVFKIFPSLDRSSTMSNDSVKVDPVSITASIENDGEVLTEAATTTASIYTTSCETEGVITTIETHPPVYYNYSETSSISIDGVSAMTYKTKTDPAVIDINDLYSASSMSNNELLLTPKTAYENICSAASVTFTISTEKPLNLVFRQGENNTHGLYEVKFFNDNSGKLLKEIMMNSDQEITVSLKELNDSDNDGTATIKIALKATGYTRTSGQTISTREVIMGVC